MSGPNITKGTRIQATWFQAKPLGTWALAGVQMKVTGSFVTVTGVCRHFRGDDPVTPTKIRVYIDPDPGTWGGPTVRPIGCSCDHPHVEINPDHIVAVV
jgi:hypothetical protein